MEGDRRPHLRTPTVLTAGATAAARFSGDAVDAGTRAGETAARRQVFAALLHGGVAPEGATGGFHRLPGPAGGCGHAPPTAGDLVAAHG
ncbi:hypothetical protein ABZ923_09510 [Streptomyces sp. NPDC046881]|uniref:hypothetical protein n=1 Tax=Streptomyces sp. NPDC046881 TaxID=3155374 RepID=UPI003411F0DA